MFETEDVSNCLVPIGCKYKSKFMCKLIIVNYTGY